VKLESLIVEEPPSERALLPPLLLENTQPVMVSVALPKSKIGVVLLPNSDPVIVTVDTFKEESWGALGLELEWK